MPEYVAKQFTFPNFATPVPGTLREVLDNDTTTREKSYLNGLGMIKVESGCVSMMLKTDYTFFKDGPPIPQKYLNTQDRIIVVRPGMKPAPKFVLAGHIKEKIGKETPSDALIVDNLETSLSTTVDKARGETSGAIL